MELEIDEVCKRLQQFRKRLSNQRLNNGINDSSVGRRRDEVDDTDFNAKLRKSSEFLNPHCVDNLCRHFGISPRALYTLSPSLASSTVSVESAKDLRKMQSYRLAMKSVVKGIERLRNKQNAEAMPHFNKALEIDPDNVEAWVGRGALYANCESFDMAIRDFDQALKLDPNHANARLYLSETVLAKEKQLEKKRRRDSGRDSQSSTKEDRPKSTTNGESEAATSDDKSADVVFVEEKRFEKKRRPDSRPFEAERRKSSIKEERPKSVANGKSKPSTDGVKLQRQLSDMEKFIAGLKAKQKS